MWWVVCGVELLSAPVPFARAWCGVLVIHSGARVVLVLALCWCSVGLSGGRGKIGLWRGSALLAAVLLQERLTAAFSDYPTLAELWCTTQPVATRIYLSYCS